MPKHEYNIKEKAILDRFNELTYPTDRLGPASAMVQASHINASRMIMINQQISQMVNLTSPESPLEPSGFENVLAQYTYMNDEADDDYEVVAKFKKNAYNYVMIGYSRKNKHYHAWERVEVEEHSSGCSTAYNNQFIDSLEIGDTIPKGTLVKKSNSFDKYGNYRYGKNLNVVYLVTTEVYEDAILIMNDADKELSTLHTTKRSFALSDNEFLLNLYGDDETGYKGLPDIGEKTKDGVLAVVRRIDNSKAPYALKKNRVDKYERGDRRYFGEGTVTDITIRCNKDISKITQAGANKLIIDLYKKQQKYYKDLYQLMINIIDNAYDGGYTYSDEFSAICKNAESFIDSSAYFADENGSLSNNIIIDVTLIANEPLITGSKIVTRSGNKGTVSNILDKEHSWHMEDGTPIHVVLSAIGIVGRLNQSQMNEHSINELSATAVRMMKATTDVKEKAKIMLRLMNYLNSDEAASFKKFIAKMDDKEKEKYFKKIERTGIYIVQDPIENANMIDIGKAYEEFKPNYQRIVFPDGGKSMRAVLCAKMFFIRLMQDPFEKYSLRSRGPINPLNNLPGKSNLSKKGLSWTSDNPVRFGEQEVEIMEAMVKHPAAISEFMAEYSTSFAAKLSIADQLYLKDPETSVTMNDITDIYDGKKNMQQILAYCAMLGTTIKIETEDAPDGELFEDS